MIWTDIYPAIKAKWSINSACEAGQCALSNHEQLRFYHQRGEEKDLEQSLSHDVALVSYKITGTPSYITMVKQLEEVKEAPFKRHYEMMVEYEGDVARFQQEIEVYD